MSVIFIKKNNYCKNILQFIIHLINEWININEILLRILLKNVELFNLEIQIYSRFKE